MNAKTDSIPVRDARNAILGTEPSSLGLTGRGTRILLIDSGLSDGSAGTPTGLGQRAHDETVHSARVANLIVGGPAAGSVEPIGIAPGAELIVWNHQGNYPEGVLPRLGRARAEDKAPDVIALPWSIAEDYRLATVGRQEFQRTAGIKPLVVAAAGHDGAERLRFPATCETVLSVGVADEWGRPTSYCGTSVTARKPELLMQQARYRTRDGGGKAAHIGGTSAAVAVMAGLAALWTEELRSRGLEPSNALLRAVLLATAVPTRDGRDRSVSADALHDRSHVVARPFERTKRLRVRIAGRPGATVRLAAVATSSERPLWTPRFPKITCTLTEQGPSAVAAARDWVVIEHELLTSNAEVDVVIEGAHESVAIAASGVAALDAEPIVERAATRAVLTVLGVSASHNASACLLRNGDVAAAIQLERLSRTKHDGRGFLQAREAIDYCLQAVGMRASDIDVFAFNNQPLLPGWTGLSMPYADARFDVFDPLGEKAVFVSHHLAHAFSAFCGSGFDDAGVLVIDGSGGSTCGDDDLILTGPELRQYLRTPLHALPPVHVVSMYRFDQRGHALLERESAASFNVRSGSSSLGETYAAVSEYVFGDWHDGGKLMGLAPYGDRTALESFLDPDAPRDRPTFGQDWKLQYRQATQRDAPMVYRNLAARIQADLETAVHARARATLQLAGTTRLAYAGGVALNAVANQQIARDVGTANLFVFPAAHDAGVAVGAAAAAARQFGGRQFRGWSDDFRGYDYSAADIQLATRDYERFVETEHLSIKQLAHRIIDGAIVGWFESASEFGPRALGHRSVLAEATRRSTWDRINQDVKFREDFRPLAPVVRTEDADQFFELDGHASPYMTRVVAVRDEYRDRLAAVCHVDGSARVQTVSRRALPRLHSLLTAVGERGGLPVLVNTSMNAAGEPIVETPRQAVELFLSTKLDLLVIGDDVIRICNLSLVDDPAIALAPGVEVAIGRKDGAVAGTITSRRQRGGYRVPKSVAQLLLAADGATAIGNLFTTFGVDRQIGGALLTAFAVERLVLFGHRARRTDWAPQA